MNSITTTRRHIIGFVFLVLLPLGAVVYALVRLTWAFWQA